jgi:Trk-type K+ transport system membrane component
MEASKALPQSRLSRPQGVKRELAASYGCALFVALAILTVPFWLLSGLAEALGLVLLGAVAAVAGVGLGLGIGAGLGDEPRRMPAAVPVNAALLAIVTAGLWMWGRYLAEPPCPTC